MNELERIAADMTKARAELERSMNTLAMVRYSDPNGRIADARLTMRAVMLLVQGWQAVITELASNPRYTAEDTEWTPDPDHPAASLYDGRTHMEKGKPGKGESDTTTGLHIEVRD